MAPASFDPYYKWLGIPPEEQPPNHYRLLGIPLFESDLDVIENAAHRQMVYVRTFQTGRNADLSQKLLNELAAAKVCLMSRSKRAAYDESLRRQMRGESGGDGAAASGIAGAEVSADDSQASDEVAASQDSADAASDSSWSGGGGSPLLDFSRPATERRDKPRGKRHGKRAKQPLVAILLLFGGLGVVAVFLIVLLLVLMFRKPKDGGKTGQAAGSPAVVPGEGTGASGLGKGAFGTGEFGKSAGTAQAGKTIAGSELSTAAGTGKTKSSTGFESSDVAAGKGTKAAKPDPNVPAVGGGQGAETGANPPGTGASSDDKRMERIRTQFDLARQALIGRDAIKAQAALGGLGSLNRDPMLREEKERLDAISRFVSEFWKSVRSGATRVKGRLEGGGNGKSGGGKGNNNKKSDNKADDDNTGENKAKDNTANENKEKGKDNKDRDNKAEDEAGGKKDEPKSGRNAKDQSADGNGQNSSDERPEPQELEFLGEVFGLADEGSRADFTLNGEPWTAPLFELPPKAAVALALLSMNDSDGFGRFYVATFLLIDQKGDPEENREIGMAMYRHAEMLSGEPNSFIEKEFELEADLLEKAAKKFSGEKLKVRQRPKRGSMTDDSSP